MAQTRNLISALKYKAQLSACEQERDDLRRKLRKYETGFEFDGGPYEGTYDDWVGRAFKAERELDAIDAALARRPALDGYKTRADMVWKACDTAAALDRDIKTVTHRAEKAERELAELREQVRWIPVEERLPKPLNDVLIVVKRYAYSNSGKSLQPADNWIEIGSIRSDKVWINDETTIGTLDEKRWAASHNGEYLQVTHWRPLGPAPEKE